jgi:hypothetical protein
VVTRLAIYMTRQRRSYDLEGLGDAKESQSNHYSQDVHWIRTSHSAVSKIVVQNKMSRLKVRCLALIRAAYRALPYSACWSRLLECARMSGKLQSIPFLCNGQLSVVFFIGACT